MSANSMTTAAQLMHTSQPQISRLVSQLEDITKFPLFERNGSRLVPTGDGLRFYRAVERTFFGLADLEEVATQIRLFSGVQLRVAAMPRLAGDLLVRIAARFHAMHPEIMLSIQSGNALDVKEWIRTGGCDVGIALLTGDAAGVQMERVSTLRCVAVLPEGHPLCRFRQLRLAHFAGMPFIRPTGESLGSEIDDLFSQAGVPLKIVAEASLGASVCALVRANVGISIVNPLAARDEFLAGGLQIRPIATNIPSEVVMLYPRSQSEPRLTSIFSALARPILREEMEALKQIYVKAGR